MSKPFFYNFAAYEYFPKIWKKNFGYIPLAEKRQITKKSHRI